MNIKKIIAFLLCCGIVLCLSACESAGTSGNTSGVFNNPTIEKPKKFSDEEEFTKYISKSFWICETENNNSKTFKLRFFNPNGIGLSWDFSYASNETLEECIQNVLKLGEEQGRSFSYGMTFLGAGLNVGGLESKRFDIEYDSKKSQINSDGQVYGTFLDDGTLKCDGDIYKSDVNNNEFCKCFIDAKLGLIEERYGEIANYKDVKYDPISYLGREFLITGTAELDDYYNYDYRDLEVVYFCICITPSGGSFSDRWYIYCDRSKYKALYEELKNGKVSNMALICCGFYPDSLKNEMANLVDYCY